jgi:hypothetical protein
MEAFAHSVSAVGDASIDLVARRQWTCLVKTPILHKRHGTRPEQNPSRGSIAGRHGDGGQMGE